MQLYFISFFQQDPDSENWRPCGPVVPQPTSSAACGSDDDDPEVVVPPAILVVGPDGVEQVKPKRQRKVYEKTRSSERSRKQRQI